jgi:hypothetical protein
MITNRILHALLPLAVLAVAATACSDEDKRALGEQDVRDSLRASTEQVLDEQGAAVDGDLECTSSIGTDGAVQGACTGTAADGTAIVAGYVGTADVDAETCTATMAITVAGAALPDRSNVDCFAM